MAFVQKIMGENAALRRQASEAAIDAVGEGSPAAPVAPPQHFDPREASTEHAAAFAGSISENDGHQIAPLLALLKEHPSDLLVCSQVCSALETLTFTYVENRRTIVQEGGATSIVETLERHQDADASMLRPCMDALWNLTFE